MLKVTIQKAIRFYRTTLNNLDPCENKNDVWRCNYSISQLEYILNIVNSDQTMKRLGEIQGCFNALNKGVEQFDSMEINREHVRLNNKLYGELLNYPA